MKKKNPAVNSQNATQTANNNKTTSLEQSVVKTVV